MADLVLNRTLTVQDVFDARGEALQLELLTPDVSLDRPVPDADISGPGLALAGFVDRFPEGRVQVFGETEMTYLATLAPEVEAQRLGALFAFAIPAVMVTKGQRVSNQFVEMAAERSIPVFRSGLGTGDFYRRIKPYLAASLAPATTLHGSLADVYGVGLLFVGQSGIGKSETVLDLVERGHRLVADDLVIVSRRGHDVLLGRAHERQGHHMEIRGIGIVDIRAMFGARATRQQKRIEVVVQLEMWDETREYDRTGLLNEEAEILGVKLPRVTIPLNPGKNLTVICEVIAMNHLLKYLGVDSAKAFHEQLLDSLRPVRDYLEEDYE